MQSIEGAISERAGLLLREVGPHAAGLYMQRITAKQRQVAEVRARYEKFMAYVEKAGIYVRPR